MKIDRQIGIITLLLRNESMTAPKLAEKFEVSRRTINRDIEDICRAGIPVVTRQGYDGGISIAEGYKIDKNLFTQEELQAIFIGLKSVDSVSGVSYSDRLSYKLTPGGKAPAASENNIHIDLSTYYKDSLMPKIKVLREAIDSRRLVSFRYFSSKGESQRSIEPYRLVFQWSSWYVYGYCLERQDFRLFKLNRLTDPELSDQVFAERELPEDDISPERFAAESDNMTILFDEEAKYRLVEAYGPDSFVETEDGKLKFDFIYQTEEEMLRWILSFGGAAEVLEPVSLRERVRAEAEKILTRYRK